MDKVTATMVFPNSLLADKFLHWLSGIGEQYLMEDTNTLNLVFKYDFEHKVVEVQEVDEE